MESWKKSTCCKSSERSRNTDAEYGFWPGKHRAGCGRNRPSATCDWVNPLARPSENQYPLSSQSIQRLPYGTHGLQGILVPGFAKREGPPERARHPLQRGRYRDHAGGCRRGNSANRQARNPPIRDRWRVDSALPPRRGLPLRGDVEATRDQGRALVLSDGPSDSYLEHPVSDCFA